MPIRVVAFVVLGAVVLAQEQEQRQWKLEPEIRSIVDLALAAPPEFSADALLRLIEGGRVPDARTRLELLEIAFSNASRAQHPIRLVAVPGTAADTRAAYHDQALRFGLDAISLQSRAVIAAAGNKDAAREFFGRMQVTVGPLTCEAALVPDPSAYYELLTTLAQRVFTGADGAKDSRTEFVQLALSRITSHTEAAPAARMIASLDWQAGQFEVVSGTYLAKLGSLAEDDRSFSFSVRDTEQSIAPLIALAGRFGLKAERISDAYRQYLVANLGAARCADNADVRARAVSAGEQPPELFGPTVRGTAGPLSADEVRAKKTGVGPKTEPYWQSEEAQRVFQQCLKLRVGADGRYLPEAARGTREWARQLSDFLNTLADWKQTSEKSEEDFYHQKAIVYEAVLELTPSGDFRNRVLDEYVGFLKSSNIQQTNPLEWYWHAKSTLKRVRGSHPEEAARMWSAFAASGNVVLSLQAALEKAVPDHSMFPN